MTFEDIYRLGVGRLGLSSKEFFLLTEKELQWKVEAYNERVEDMWDYVRHIMAPMAGGDPKKIINLSRDDIRLTVDEDTLNSAKEFFNRAKNET